VAAAAQTREDERSWTSYRRVTGSRRPRSTCSNERGYEQTTIDDIAERAGLGRATFFRHYRSKEDVIFPDHDRLLDRVRDRLRSTGHGTALAAACDAVRLVLLHYLDEGDLARRRYLLTSTVPALRDPRDRQRGPLPAAVPRVHRRADGGR